MVRPIRPNRVATKDSHARRRCRVSRQGQDNQQVSRWGLHGTRVLRPCPRPAPEGRLGRSRPRLRDDLGDRQRQPEARSRDCRGTQGRPQPDSRDRPRPRGRGDQLAPPGSPDQAQGAEEGHAGQPGGVQRDHQVRRDRGDEGPAPGRHGTGPCVSRPPRARLPGGLQPVAGAVAQAAGREVGRAGAVGLPAADRGARDRDRGVHGAGILDGVGRAGDPARPDLHRAAGQLRRQAAGQVRSRHRGPGRSCGQRDRETRARRHLGRGEAGHAEPLGPVHDLDAAAGGQPQVRDGRAPDDERGATALRGGLHHLHADRRHRHGPGSGDRCPRGHRGPVRQGIPARLAPDLQEQGQERAGGTRVHPADRDDAGPRCAEGHRRRPAQALRPDLEADARQPDGGRPAGAHHGRHRLGGRAGRPACHRAGGALRRVHGGLHRGSGRRGGRRRRGAPARADAGRCHRQEKRRARAAFHPAAAALHRGDAGQADGGARDRAPVDLCLDRHDDPGPGLCPQGQEPPDPGGQGTPRDGVPDQLLPQVRGLRLHRRPREPARRGQRGREGLPRRARPVLARLQGGDRRYRRTAHHRRSGHHQRGARAAHLPRQGGRHRSAPLPELRRGAAEPQDRALGRRLHRLLELPGMPVHPPVRPAGRGRRRDGTGRQALGA